MTLQNNPNFIRFKWRLKRKHLPAKCVMRATESRRMEIRLNKLSFWNTAINTKCKYKYRIEILNATYFIMSSVVISDHSLSLSMPFLSNIKCSLRDDTHMTSMKIVQFSGVPPPSFIYIQNSSTPLTLDVQFQRNPAPQ